MTSVGGAGIRRRRWSDAARPAVLANSGALRGRPEIHMDDLQSGRRASPMKERANACSVGMGIAPFTGSEAFRRGLPRST